MTAERGQRGERGPTGDHGPTGPTGPRSVAISLAIALFAVVMVLGFAFTKSETHRAISASRDQTVAEQERADLAICSIAQSNRERIISINEKLLGLIRLPPTTPQTPAQVEARAEAVRVLEDELRHAREPFPPPCERFVLD